MTSTGSACRAYEVTINGWALYRVLGMPGMTRIDLRPGTATLTFETAPGCEPAGLEFVAGEVQRISGGQALEAREGEVMKDNGLKTRERVEYRDADSFKAAVAADYAEAAGGFRCSSGCKASAPCHAACPDRPADALRRLAS